MKGESLMNVTRREFFAATAVAPLAWFFPPQSNTRPNILFILADDLGYADLSCYGRRDYTTPNIDRLAAQGMRFTQAYANSAVCTATRVALITGRYQYRLPVGLEEPLANSPRNVGLPPAHPTLPSLLKTAGYGTTLIGKWHMGWLPDFSPLKSGYDHFWGFRGGALDYFTHKSGPASTNTDDLWDGETKIQQTGYLTDLMGDRAVSSINEYVKARQPFFISLHFNAPHWPWEAPGDQAESERIGTLAHYDGGTLETYARMVRQMDSQVGRILRTLDTAGIANNTVVVFTSDNGGERFSDTWPFTGKKMELLEGGLRIPAIVRWPGHVRPNSTTAQVAISMDWLPTFLEIGGAKPDTAYLPDGISLVPALTQNAAPVVRKLFWRFKANAQRAVRDGDMKWLEIDGNTFLFNVATDPLERANLKNRLPDVYKKLVAEYTDWETTMLPLDPASNTGSFYGSEYADHFGNKRK
jgi:arylsulfatase A-like enzyme